MGPVHMLVPHDEAKMTTRQQGLGQVIFEMHSWRMGVSESSSWQVFQNKSIRLGGGRATRRGAGQRSWVQWLIPPLVDSETLLPGLDSSTEPMIIMGVWDTAREGHHHCSQGFWPEGRDLGL